MARKDEFEFDIPDKKEKPRREKKESKPIFGEGSSLGGLFKKSSSDDFEFSVGEDKKEKQREKKDGKPLFGEGSSLGGLFKKSSSDDFELSVGEDKKEKQREKKDGKPLFGEDSSLGGLFKKSSSDDFDLSLDEGNNEKSGKKSSKRLKWWYILLIVLGSIIVVVGIVAAILIGIVNNEVPGGIGGIIGGGNFNEEIPEPEGVVSSVGTFLPNDAQEYILCEYTEYFSGETIIVLQKPGEVRYDYKRYWVFISEDGQPNYHFSDEFPENDTPEQVKKDLFDVLQVFGYTKEELALCDMHVYNPVSFTRVKISEVTLTETDVTVKYNAGAVDGEMSEEYTLTGTYTKAENDYTFTYTNLPEDENLLRVAENLLVSAKYANYAQYGDWVNELTFGDNYKLTLVTPTEE